MKKMPPTFSKFLQELADFASFLRVYFTHKGLTFSVFFEKQKNAVVKSVLIKRGKRHRMFLHISAMALITAGIIISPYVADTNPFFAQENNATLAQASQESYLVSEDVFSTQRSDKPRDRVITYTVQNGDTLSSLAKRFQISEDTIKWANDMRSDTITTGDQLKILPVTGVSHKVESGDTVYSVAKRYNVDAQAIVNFPFNEYANPQTFSLVTGQILIVPDGVPPQEKPKIIRPRYIATGPIEVTASGFSWPLQGTLNQYFSWYHPALDLGAALGTPIVAAQNGEVAEAYTSGWNSGYGIHVIIRGENGYNTLYAHMSALNISVGEVVSAGKTILGWVGLTGRTTGPHLHFEIRGPAGNVNPLSFLQ